jgi:FAS-associated factor 2
MADSAVDLTSLSADQQLALQQFTAVTAQDLKEAIPLLHRCQWNVQIAIARFFDGEPAEDPVAAAAQQPAAPADTRRAENLANNFEAAARATSNNLRRPRIEPAPRVVPQPESQIDTRAPLVFSLLWAPVGLLYSLLARSLRFIGYFFPFLPRAWGRITASTIRNPAAARRSAGGRRALPPRDTAARFIREFTEEYGENSLPFHEGSYASAFDAAKKDLKYLLVILLAPEHDLTPSFCTSTLLDPAVVSFLLDPNNNLILWAGSIADAEPYAVSAALNCTKHPFSALVVHTPSAGAGSMGIAARLAGPLTPAVYLRKLRAAMAAHDDTLSRARAQRSEQNASRSIRSQQDSAYERSLAVDRERKRKAEEEKKEKEREEKEALEAQAREERYAANLAVWRKWRAGRVKAEPAADAPAKDVVRISLRLPSAERVVRRFHAEDGIEEVYAYVECYDILSGERGEPGEGGNGMVAASEGKGDEADVDDDFEHAYAFRLVSPMPREVFDVKEGGSVGQRIGRSGNLIVEAISEEDDEEGEEEE